MDNQEAIWQHHESLKARGLNLYLPDKLENHQEGYTVVPTRLVYDADLSYAARVLYCCLLSFDYAKNGRRKNRVWPGQGTLAKAMGGVSTRSVRRAMCELELRDYVTVIHQGKGLPNEYHLHLTVNGKAVRDTRKALAVFETEKAQLGGVQV